MVETWIYHYIHARDERTLRTMETHHQRRKWQSQLKLVGKVLTSVFLDSSRDNNNQLLSKGPKYNWRVEC